MAILLNSVKVYHALLTFNIVLCLILGNPLGSQSIAFVISAASRALNRRRVPLVSIFRTIAIACGILYLISRSVRDIDVGEGSLQSGSGAYGILGVTPLSDSKEIRRAFKKLSIEYHPDKVSPHDRGRIYGSGNSDRLDPLDQPDQLDQSDQSDQANQANQLSHLDHFDTLRLAYDTLRDPFYRLLYDSTGITMATSWKSSPQTAILETMNFYRSKASFYLTRGIYEILAMLLVRDKQYSRMFVTRIVVIALFALLDQYITAANLIVMSLPAFQTSRLVQRGGMEIALLVGNFI